MYYGKTERNRQKEKKREIERDLGVILKLFSNNFFIIIIFYLIC